MINGKYAYLNKINPLPWVIREAIKLHGTLEVPGAGNNKTILEWVKEVGGWEVNYYTKDSIPWCGLFCAVVCKRAKKAVPKNWLRAMAWASFGVAINPEQAALGDVLVFRRGGGGHVGFYVAEDSMCYHVLGGNQSDKVCITRIPKSRIYSVNRPVYVNQPVTVEKIFLSADGTISENEA